MAQGGACAQSEEKRASMHPEPAAGMKNPNLRLLPRPFASREAPDSVEIRNLSHQPRAV
jgi:hypothetical protein